MHLSRMSLQALRVVPRTAAGVVLLAALCGAADDLSAAQASVAREPIEPVPLQLNLDHARVRLGEALFRDPRLSRDGRRSCASCHPLDHGGMDSRERAQSNNPSRLLRNTPTIFNVGLNLFYNWDATTETLPEHDDRAIRSDALMAADWPQLLATLRADTSYVEQFKASYPAGIERETVLDALAVYERSLITPNSRFDRFLRGDAAALSTEERNGYGLFKSYGCIACHQGINVGGNLVQRFGVFGDTGSATGSGERDQGRYQTTKDPRDKDVFRVPSLRNVEVTAPYFHDGRAPTLEVAVVTMARVQLGINLSATDTRQIVAFLRTLTGEYGGRPLVPGTPERAP